MDVAPILPAEEHTYTHGWMLYTFWWDFHRYPFCFDLEDSTVFVPVLTYAAPKPDGTFCTPKTIYARKNFDLGEPERGFRGNWSYTFSSLYQVVVLRPDLVVFNLDVQNAPYTRETWNRLQVSPTAP